MTEDAHSITMDGLAARALDKASELLAQRPGALSVAKLAIGELARASAPLDVRAHLLERVADQNKPKTALACVAEVCAAVWLTRIGSLEAPEGFERGTDGVIDLGWTATGGLEVKMDDNALDSGILDGVPPGVASSVADALRERLGGDIIVDMEWLGNHRPTNEELGGDQRRIASELVGYIMASSEWAEAVGREHFSASISWMPGADSGLRGACAGIRVRALSRRPFHTTISMFDAREGYTTLAERIAAHARGKARNHDGPFSLAYVHLPGANRDALPRRLAWALKHLREDLAVLPSNLVGVATLDVKSGERLEIEVRGERLAPAEALPGCLALPDAPRTASPQDL